MTPELQAIIDRHEARIKACGDKLMNAERDLSVVLALTEGLICHCADLADNCTINPSSPVGLERGTVYIDGHNTACWRIAKVIRNLKSQ